MGICCVSIYQEQMLIIIRSPVDKVTLKKVAEDLEGYIKFVTDVERKIITAGGLRHFEGEQLLLRDGSRQGNLWGGGLDLETGEVDFDSMVNLRPNDNNSSREVLSQDLRKKIEEIVRYLLEQPK
ncbi:MAG: DUF5674 family protein [bacterium]|nr:DUF5674 family protein [bacterium]